jgi:hypothetical protein
LAEQQVAAGTVLGDLEVQGAFIDLGAAADGQRGTDPLQPGSAGDLDAAAVHAQDPPAGGQALEADHDRIGAGLGQEPAALAVLVAEPDLAGAGAGGAERAGDHVGHGELAGQEGAGNSLDTMSAAARIGLRRSAIGALDRYDGNSPRSWQ